MASPPNQQPADLTSSASINALGPGTLPAAITASGAGVVVLVSKTGRSNWIAQLSALPAGMTLNFAASFDGGATYHTISGTQLGGVGNLVSSTTSANNVAGENNSQVWIGMAAGLTHLAVWCSAYISGSVSVVLVVSAATRHVVLNNGLPPSTSRIGVVTTDQTTHGTTDLVAADVTKVGGAALALGQAVAGASLPVVLPAAQVTSLTPPAAITGFAIEAGHLASIDTKLPATISGGLPVNIVAGGSGGGGGAVTVADGADVTLGAKADAAITNPATSGTLMSALRGMLTLLAARLLTNQSAGAPVALSSPAAALTANTDTSFTFSSTVGHVYLQNKSASPVYVNWDAAATVGAQVIQANGGSLFFDIPVTVVHLLSVPATNVNGTADLNVVLKGWS